jgi:nitronate monooxygenase
VVDRFSLTDLSVRIVGAPMAGGPSTPQLAAAVSNAGGLGFLAAGMLSAMQLAEALLVTRGLTSGAIAVNLFAPQQYRGNAEQFRRFAAAISGEAARYGVSLGEPFHDDDGWAAKLDVMCDLRPEVVSFTFGLPTRDQCRRLTDAGILTLATVTSVDEAVIALNCGVDAVVAQGPGAGGHRATFDQLATPPAATLEDLVAALTAEVDCPVVAAGGLATTADVQRVRGAGAVAAQIGTALLLANEAGTNSVHRAALRDPQFDRTVVTRVFTGRYARSLRNRFIDEHDQDAIFGFPAVARMTGPILAAAVRNGDPHGTSLWAGIAFKDAQTGSAVDIVRKLAA